MASICSLGKVASRKKEVDLREYIKDICRKLCVITERKLSVNWAHSN